MYVIPMLYRISSSTNPLSVSRLCRAFHSVLIKHHVLRTALYVDEDGIVVQRCLDTNIITDDAKPFGFSVINMENNNGDDDHGVAKTMNNILNDANLFDLSKGRVIQCHVLRRYRHDDDTLSSRNDDLLIENDSILFNIHHSVFDGASFSIFLADLSVAYGSDDLLSIDHAETIQYMDYSVYERQMDMSLSRDFWRSQFQGYNLQSSLLLPVDRQRSLADQRSGLASIVDITFDNDVATSFLNYASSHHVTPFQLGLAIFYAFLFKLTHGQHDLCIASINANRYRNELQNVIGMFVSTLPYRIELDPCWTFDDLVKHVQEKCLAILSHTNYPLQHILADFHLNQSKVPFLETVFDFMTISPTSHRSLLNDTSLEAVSMNPNSQAAKFDFMLTFKYNPVSCDKRLTCCFVYSNDVYEQNTATRIAERFRCLFERLFGLQSNVVEIGRSNMSVRRLSLILPEEYNEVGEICLDEMPDITHQGLYINRIIVKLFLMSA